MYVGVYACMYISVIATGYTGMCIYDKDIKAHLCVFSSILIVSESLFCFSQFPLYQGYRIIDYDKYYLKLKLSSSRIIVHIQILLTQMWRHQK